MPSRILSLIYPLTRVLLAFRVAMLLLAPALLVHADGGAWQQFPGSPVATQPITALVADRSGHVWAGTEERGLARWAGEAWTPYTIAAGLPDMRVVALFEDSRERLWVATGNGLGYFPADRGAFRRVGLAGIPALPVTAFAEDAAGGVWLGTPRGLVAWGEDGAFEIAEGLMGQRIASLASAEGAVWAATGDGVWRGTAEGWTRAEPPAPAGITRLTAAQDGALYALADGGVWQRDGAAWRSLPAPFDRRITAFGVRGTRLWAAAGGRIYAAEGGITQGYEAALPGSTVDVIAIGQDGAAWFGTRSGLGVYQPGLAPPQIAGISVNGAQPGAAAVSLARNRIQSLTVSVKGSRAGGPQQTVLLAQLDGVDDGPRVVDGSLSDAYRDVRLAPGRHTLRVWAVDGDFNRSEGARVVIDVPDLTYLPFGLALPTEIVAPLLAALALPAVAIITVIAAVALGTRAARRKAEREAARVRGILATTSNPYEEGLAHEPALRAEQAQEIIAALTGANGRSALLLGPRGMGKTTLLRSLAAAQGLAAAYIDLAETREADFFGRAMAGLYDALTPRMVGERPRLECHVRAAVDYGEREFAADANRLFAFLRPASAGPLHAALLLDNAGALDGYSGATRDAVRRLVLASASANAALRLVLAAEIAPVSLEGLTDALTVVHLPPLPAPALARLLLAPTRGAYEWDDEAAAGAVALSGGRPGSLREIAERAVASARRNGRVRIAQADVAPIRLAP